MNRKTLVVLATVAALSSAASAVWAGPGGSKGANPSAPGRAAKTTTTTSTTTTTTAPPTGTCYEGLELDTPDLHVEASEELADLLYMSTFGTYDGTCQGADLESLLGVVAESDAAALALCVENADGRSFGSVRLLSELWDTPPGMWLCEEFVETCYPAISVEGPPDLLVVGTLGTLGNGSFTTSYDGTCTGDSGLTVTVLEAADEAAFELACSALYPGAIVLGSRLSDGWVTTSETLWVCAPMPVEPS